MKLKTILIILMVIGIDLAALWWWRAYQLDHSQDATIIAAASIYEMDPALIKAVIWRESRFNPKVRGASGELGLMQIRDVAAGEWAKAESITNFHHQHTDDPIIYGLAEYNAGRSNVLKWNSGDAATNSVAFIEAIEFPATRDYILSIQKRREKYRDLR